MKIRLHTKRCKKAVTEQIKLYVISTSLKFNIDNLYIALKGLIGYGKKSD